MNEVRIIPIEEKQFLYDFLKENSKIVGIEKWEKDFLSEARISYFYGCNVMFHFTGETPTGFIAYKQSKEYLNIYFIFTSLMFRGMGIQKELIAECLKEPSVKRIYSSASTPNSAILYYKLGFSFYGLSKKGELLTDTGEGSPTKVLKQLKEAVLMSKKQLFKALVDKAGRFKLEPDFVRELLSDKSKVNVDI